MSKTKRTAGELHKIAAEMQKALSMPKKNELFRQAVEAGYLTALADGDADSGEKSALVDAMHTLSNGLVVEWEVDALIEECAKGIQDASHAKRCEAVGTKLSELGQPEAGLLLGAYVALATAGLDKKEAQTLERIGKAAGLDKKQVAAVVKRARATVGE